MTSDETVVTSFVAEDEELVGTWTVTTASHGKGHLPPMGGEEVVAVTDERVLWFTDELEEVRIDDLADVEREFVERQAAPPMVLAAGLLVVVGLFGSVGAFFANAGGPLVVAFPALSGFAIFLVAKVVARATGREGETRSGHRLRLWTEDGAVSIWGEEGDIADVDAAISDDEAPVDATDGDTTEPDPTDEDTTEADPTVEDGDEPDGTGGTDTGERTTDDATE